jgi:Uma2 family endonuclease
MRNMSAIHERPQRHAITVEEYMRMGEARVFASDVRLELMDGEIIEMAPIGSRHAAIVNTLAALLGKMDQRAIVSVQNPLIVDQRSVPQPDLVLLRARADKYYAAHPTATDALLVIEVADTTLEFDLNVKVPLYASAGIVEVWVIDIEQRTLHIFREPQQSRYTVCLKLSGDDVVTPLRTATGIVIAELFPG